VLVGGAVLRPQTLSAQETIRLSLRSSYASTAVGFYLADLLGYYAEEGIDIEIIDADDPLVERGGAADALRGRETDLAIAGTDLLLDAQSPTEFVAVFSLYQTSAGRMFVKTDAEVSRINDLARLPIVLPTAGSRLAVETEALFAANGIPIATLDAVPVGEGADAVARIMSPEIQGFPGSLLSTRFVMSALGVEVEPVHPESSGLDFYGDTVFATRRFVSESPDLVDRFIVASRRGWETALADREAAVDYLVQNHALPPILPPSIPERAFVEWQMDQLAQLTGYPVTEIGYSSHVRWNRIAEALIELGMMEPMVVRPDFVFDYQRMVELQRQWRLRVISIVLAVLLSFVVVSSVVYRSRLRVRRQRELESFFDGLLHGLAAFAPSGMGYRLVRCNREWESITGVTMDRGAKVPPEAVDDMLAVLGVSDARELLSVADSGGHHVRRTQTTDWSLIFALSVFPIADGLVGCAVSDVTADHTAQVALEELVRQRTRTIQELHHRVRNNMQIIMSLMRLQADRLTTPEVEQFHASVENQIRSISIAHGLLYEEFSEHGIPLLDYLRRLARDSFVGAAAHTRDTQARVAVRGDSASYIVSIDAAVPIGLIVNEAITNAVRHAFHTNAGRVAGSESGDESGSEVRRASTDNTGDTVADGTDNLIEVRCSVDDAGGVVITVSDNGSGYYPASSAGAGFGIQIMRLLASQLFADFSIDTPPGGGGTVCRLVVPAAHR
jgi:two-component sensor histidine kinase/ABC-type nitrate/sulfonate/bicarbonate transport system substrate-binding protein